MEIVLPQEFLSITRNKFILFDTCIFIDAFSHRAEFGEFFDNLKNNNCTILTSNLVLNEFLKGSQTEEKFELKKQYVNTIVDTVLPVHDLQPNIEMLIKRYGIDSKDLSETDLNLGSLLVKYQKNIFLLTRDLSDFPANIFYRESLINAAYNKGIFVYGLFAFK